MTVKPSGSLRVVCRAGTGSGLVSSAGRLRGPCRVRRRRRCRRVRSPKTAHSRPAVLTPPRLPEPSSGVHVRALPEPPASPFLPIRRRRRRPQGGAAGGRAGDNEDAGATKTSQRKGHRGESKRERFRAGPGPLPFRTTRETGARFCRWETDIPTPGLGEPVNPHPRP